jgi:hypothetical protein
MEARSRMMRMRVLIPGVASVWVFSAGCTGGSGPVAEERAYSIPDTVCGVGIDREAFAPLFPAGESYHENGDMLDREGKMSAHGACEIYVDRMLSFSTFVLTLGDGEGLGDALDVLRWQVLIEDSEPVESGWYETAVWPDRAISHVSCSESSTFNGVVVTFIARSTDDDRSEVLKEVIEPYTQELISQLSPDDCEAT